MDVEPLIKYYLCEDLDRRNPSFYDELIRRSKTLIVNGVKFPMPRRLKELIYYESTFDSKGFRKLRKIPVYSMALARTRARDLENFDRQLRESSKGNDSLVDFSHCEAIIRQDSLLEGRESRAEAYLDRQHRKDNR